MEQDFQFIKETRKEKPVNRRKLLFRVLETLILAVLFGVIACLVFVLLRPRFEEAFGLNQQPQQVVFEEEQPPVVDIPQESEKPEEENEKEEPETVIINKTQAMDLNEYQVLLNKLYSIGRKADNFIVAVTGVSNDTDLFNTTYESKGVGSGVIVAELEENLLVLTERKILRGASSIEVTFADDATVAGELLKYDGNTGLAIVQIKLADIPKDTRKHIEIAKLGSSVGTPVGQMVLAVGSPLGTIHSILAGNITSNKNSISTIDRNYTVFTTDMVGSSDGSGAIINLDGEIIGFVLQDYNLQKSQTTLTAVSISELKRVIELLSNNKDIPYLGMKISTVTDEIAEEYHIPMGVYVREVAVDSPAMKAGLQSGDVITMIDDTEIIIAEDYENHIMNLVPEQEVKITYERQGGENYIPLECNATVGILTKE